MSKKTDLTAVPAAAAAADDFMAPVPVPAPALPAPVYNTDFGTGFEDFTADDVAIPFLGILQKGNPQVEEDNPKHIPGAKPSMIFNTATGELFEGKEQGVVLIPVHRIRQFIEWIPKDDGGGLVAVYEPTDPFVLAALERHAGKFGKIEVNDGNELVETISVFCLQVKPDGTRERVIVSFASSQIGCYKKWMYMAQMVQVPNGRGGRQHAPLWAHQYRLRTMFHQKKEYTWYKYVIGWHGDDATSSRLAPSDDLFMEAGAFRALVLGGNIKIQHQREEFGDDAAAGAGGSFDDTSDM